MDRETATEVLRSALDERCAVELEPDRTLGDIGLDSLDVLDLLLDIEERVERLVGPGRFDADRFKARDVLSVPASELIARLAAA